jgi:uracil phosphoribosyltransferase
MESFKNLRTVIISLVAFVIIGLLATLLASGYRPSDATIKTLVEKQVAKHIKDGTITSISILRGASFPSQAHQSKVAYGTTLYPIVVTVTYTTKPKDGSAPESQQITRTLNLYKDASHQWINDDELH